MQIAIIGTGNVGQALGKSFTRAGNEVVYAARDAEKARDVARTVAGKAVDSPADAVAQADLVVLAIPWTAIEDVAGQIGPSSAGKTVFDVTNPIKPDGSGMATEGGPSGGETVASLMPGARVVKVFNTVFAAVQVDPAAQPGQIDALFATDDEQAKATAGSILSSMGFRPIHVGSLARARELESLAWLNMQMQMAHQGGWNTSFVLVNPPAAAVAGPKT